MNTRTVFSRVACAIASIAITLTLFSGVASLADPSVAAASSIAKAAPVMVAVR